MFRPRKLMHYLFDIRDRQRVNIALSRGAAMLSARRVDLSRPGTWEFSGFSQNGEDGILEILRRNLLRQNRYFVEIGSSDGVENNTAWLAVTEKYNGLMIEGDRWLTERAQRMVAGQNIGVECLSMFVNAENVHQLRALCVCSDPDVFSLDIDGNDYYVARALLEGGFRPKIFIVEYNSVYGPQRSKTIEYRPDFMFTRAHPTQLYYGVSIQGWRKFFNDYGYHFVTVEQNGVNAFFVDPSIFQRDFLSNVVPLEYAENRYQHRKFHMSSEMQFELISRMPLFDI